MKFKIKDIRPNPFRHLDRYPIQRAKVEALRESLRKTGFWGNINARKVDGKAQIAYGHHRLIALQEEWGDERAVDLIIKPLTDENMIQMMARENMEEWGADFTIHLETVRAIVEAYADGSIELETTTAQGAIRLLRDAPSFVLFGGGTGRPPRKPYTATSIGKFLGWLQPDGKASKNVRLAVRALELIELGFLTDDEFSGLSGKKAEAVMAQTLASFRAHQPAAPKGSPKTALAPKAASAEAKKISAKVGHEVAEAFKADKITIHEAPKVRRKAEPKRDTPPPMIETVANSTANRIAAMLFSDKQKDNLSDLLDHKKHLPEKSKKSLIKALSDLALRAKRLAENFE